MAASEPPIYSLRPTLIAAIALCLCLCLCLCLSCTAGCISFPTSSDEATYRPPAFEPTLRPTHIPVPSPTIVFEPTDNLTAAVD
ncbi:hypothetical protein [Methanogenium cariaci]|jgi:hypothetical protein